MKCHTHQDVDAIGVCYACHCGVCPECETWIQEKLACGKSECAEVVERNEFIVNRNFKAISSWKDDIKFGPNVLIGIGIFILLFSIMTFDGLADPTGFIFTILGAYFLIVGIRNRRKWMRITSDQDKPPAET
ncbi:MAG: hypothetical protein EP340_02945 [Alphaproteobacteria bacterium]|nr:MAG: hypothetical protein EP340_02945 [Alphaproteobacteria bacterium]